MSQPPKERNISLSHNIEMSFRVHGIPEDPDKTCDQNFVPTHENTVHILKTIEVEAETVNLRRLGKFQKEWPKPRAVLVTLPSTAVNLVMAQCGTRFRQSLSPWIAAATSNQMKKLNTQRIKLATRPTNYRKNKVRAFEAEVLDNCKADCIAYQENVFGTKNTNEIFHHLKDINKAPRIPKTVENKEESASTTQSKAELFNTSKDLKVTSGVPQGSLLWPLLFCIFINNLPDVLIFSQPFFAEDLKILAIGKTNEEAIGIVVNHRT